MALVWGAVCEALIIGAPGAFVAVLMTRGALAALAIAEPTILTAPFGVTFDPSAWRIDWGLVATAVALAAVAALIFGLAPAWKTTRLDASSFLRVGSGVKAGGLRQLRLTRPRGLMMAVETALALALTLPALLLVRTLGHLVRPTWDSAHSRSPRRSCAFPRARTRSRRRSASSPRRRVVWRRLLASRARAG
jgi:hypothetical protein